MTSPSEKPQPQPLSRQEVLAKMPAAEFVQRELASAKSLGDFGGKEGIFARLFASTLEQFLEVEMTEHLGYASYVSGWGSAGPTTTYERKGRLSEQLKIENCMRLLRPWCWNLLGMDIVEWLRNWQGEDGK